MARATQQRREILGKAIVEIAERRIAENGYRALTARDVAAEAGCSVGAIYNVFDDMDSLAAAVNTRTAARLEDAVHRALSGERDRMGAKRQLVMLGKTYFAFVTENPLLWSAIFELDSRARPDLAARREAENVRLILYIVTPLRTLLPAVSDERLTSIARALFAAVHGIVSLGQQRRFLAESPEEVATQITFIIEAFCDGLASNTPKS